MSSSSRLSYAKWLVPDHVYSRRCHPSTLRARSLHLSDPAINSYSSVQEIIETHKDTHNTTEPTYTESYESEGCQPLGFKIQYQMDQEPPTCMHHTSSPYDEFDTDVLHPLEDHLDRTPRDRYPEIPYPFDLAAEPTQLGFLEHNNTLDFGSGELDAYAIFPLAKTTAKKISDDEVSDAEGDYDFNISLAKFKDTIVGIPDSIEHVDETGSLLSLGVQGLGSQRSHQIRQPFGRPPRRGAPKGPRKAVEPTADLKMRLGAANAYFQDLKYADATSAAAEIIRINAETYEAWVLMASSLHEMGQFDNALKALMYAAHLRPKEPRPWLVAADYALTETGPMREQYLGNAAFCYSGAIRANPQDIDARFKKASILVERGYIRHAILEYKSILSRRPHDLDVLCTLAELSIDYGGVHDVIDLYSDTIAHFKTSIDGSNLHFGWTNVDVYVTLHEYAGNHELAIIELKSLARWLLGRKDEIYWDDITDNDCEWDLDDSRRATISSYESGKYSLVSYGKGLPIELRMKLGSCRLQIGCHAEALTHFDALDLLDSAGEIRAVDCVDFLRPVAEGLFGAQLYQQALPYFLALAKIPDESDSLVLNQIGKCFLQLENDEEAEKHFAAALREDQDNIDARMELAKMCERLGRTEDAFSLVNQVMQLRRTQHAEGCDEDDDRTSEFAEPKKRKGKRQKKPAMKGSKKGSVYMDERSKAEHLKSQLQVLTKELEPMRTGNLKSLALWMGAAKDLTDDFRSFKTFYPWDKFIKFIGYGGDSRLLAETSLDLDLTAMAERLSRGLGADTTNNPPADIEIPADYRGISFTIWLDIFLEYALCLARNGHGRESYELCEAAKDAIVFYHSRKDMFLINTCWCLCALFSNDEESCVSVARFFMREYQFTTDSYRLFSAMLRICQSPVSWYSSGPSQKYILRQIKAMDFSLIDDARKQVHFAEKGSYSARDEMGNTIVNTDMDVSLLMLYGHILYAGTSYAYALNYFLRANSLDPNNPMICLSIGLAYIHHGLKRQAENRQHSILQGITFVFSYYNNRKHAKTMEERQEAHFNVARTYHLLGLVQLAIPYYLKVFDELTADDAQSTQEDLVFDTAYNLQSIYATAGNLELARQITCRWLQV